MNEFNIFESVFNNASDGEFLFSTDPSLTILAVNDRALAAVSRTRDDVVGKPLFDAFPADPGDTKNSGVVALHQSLTKVINTASIDRLAI